MKGEKILLADFGFSREVEGQTAGKAFTTVGTFCYQDPAIDNGHQESADLWSLVVTSFELACLRLPFGPFDTNKYSTIVNYSYRAKKAEFSFTASESERLSPEFRDLVCRVLKAEPTDRLTFSQLPTHPWMI